MKTALKIVGGLLALAIIGVVGFLSLSPGLRSDPTIGLSPDTHAFGGVDVRAYTDAPLGAEVKVFLPIPVAEAVPIVADFASYKTWVSPAPKNVVIDNSARATGDFGPGSLVSYSEGETDEIVLYDPTVAMIAQPRWALDDLNGHRGVVIVTPYENGSIMHMRRYFVTTSLRGWMLSKMMPIFMENSAKNLAAKFGGQVF